MKENITVILLILATATAIAQKPSKEQMAADKKKYEEAQKKFNEQLSKMDPKSRQMFDSMMNSMGANKKIDTAVKKVAYNQPSKTAAFAKGTIPAKNTKAIASIASTPSVAGLSAYISNTSAATFTAVLPAAKNKALEIYKALKDKGGTADEMGNAAVALWMNGRTQIALSLMAQVCKDDAANTDNLSNYASMLSMMGAPEQAIPILNNLNARFKKNSTLLNNLGQAWFALGDADKASKYLDSTLMFAANHAQAHETKCLIAESKGNKTAAIAHAKAAFKQGNTQARKDKLKQLGYAIGADDYNNFPPTSKSDDLLNLGAFTAMEFPKSYAAMKVYEQQRKQFLAEIDRVEKTLKKITDESNKATMKQLEEQQKQFTNAMKKATNNPGSVSQAEAMKIVRAPMFSEKMNAKEKLVLENLQRRKNEILKKIADFRNGNGAAYKKEYDATMNKINERWKNVGQGGSENNEVLCNESVKAVDVYLNAINTRYEELYNEYLTVQKQYLNELSYLSLYTAYPELQPGINAGLKQQWLKDLSFQAEVLGVSYGCSGEGKIKEGKITQFKDPNCNINSEFGQNLGIANMGFKITLTCTELTTEFSALAFGIKLTQDLDHAGFGDSFKNCTVSIGPKTSFGGKVGPLEAGVNVGGGIDVEIDRNGKYDVVIKAGAEIEAGFHNSTINDPGLLGTAASGSAGVEGRISLITGASSITPTGILDRPNK